MTWYLHYQRAEDIIAEHQRRARALRQERLADESAALAASLAGQQSSPSVVRRALGRTADSLPDKSRLAAAGRPSICCLFVMPANSGSPVWLPFVPLGLDLRTLLPSASCSDLVRASTSF